MPPSLTDTKTPRLDALALLHKDTQPPAEMNPLTELLLSIHWSLDGLRGDRRGSGPYGALEHIASAVEDFLEDQEPDDE